MNQPSAGNNLAPYTVSDSLPQSSPTIQPVSESTDATSFRPDDTDKEKDLKDTAHVDSLCIPEFQKLLAGGSRQWAATKPPTLPTVLSKPPASQDMPQRPEPDSVRVRNLLQQFQSVVSNGLTSAGCEELPIDAFDSPPKVNIVRDGASRIRLVYMAIAGRNISLQFDHDGDLIALRSDGKDVSEVISFAPDGAPVAKEVTGNDFSQVTVFDNFGRRRNQQTITPAYQENVLFGPQGEVASKVKQSASGYEVYVLHANGGVLKESSDSRHYWRYERKANGSSISMFTDRVLNITSRSWFDPHEGIRQLIESTTQTIDTQCDMSGKTQSRTVTFKDR
jgi:hypothetical protein